MNTFAQKLDLIHWITELNDVSILNRIKSIKEETNEADWWDSISPKEKASIERGLEDIKKGNIHSHSEVRTHYEKWLKD